MMVDCIVKVLKWMCSEQAANIGHLLKGVGLCGVAGMGWIWLIEYRAWRGK